MCLSGRAGGGGGGWGVRGLGLEGLSLGINPTVRDASYFCKLSFILFFKQ